MNELVLNAEIYLEVTEPQTIQELATLLDDAVRTALPNTEQIVITLPTWQFENSEE